MTEIARHRPDGFGFNQLFPAKRILSAANRVLNPSGNIFALAFSFELGITGNLANDFFHDTFGLLCRSLDHFQSVARGHFYRPTT
jgi:hypothetical protein